MSAPVVVMDEAALRRIVAEEVAKLREPLAASAGAPAAATRPAMLSPGDLAALLAVDVRTLRRMVHAGEVPPGMRIGMKVIRWRKEAIDRWLESSAEALRIRKG